MITVILIKIFVEEKNSENAEKIQDKNMKIRKRKKNMQASEALSSLVDYITAHLTETVCLDTFDLLLTPTWHLYIYGTTPSVDIVLVFHTFVPIDACNTHPF